MKTIVMYRYGGPEVLRYEDIPTPVPGRGEVLLRVVGTSFNPGDATVRAGHAGPYARRFPLVAGFDAAGIVAALGPGVHGHSVGDRVIAYLIRSQDGATGEFATAPSDQLAAAPTRIPLATAAAFPVAGLTAWQAIHENLEVRPGQRILINGAGGGVGRLAVQFAKLAGATVIGVAGPASVEAAHTAGADEVIRLHLRPPGRPGGRRLQRSAGAGRRPSRPDSSRRQAALDHRSTFRCATTRRQNYRHGRPPGNGRSRRDRSLG
jgi:NADPH:quinone reductase-like Zn-dependent oxidoreductase